MGDLMNMSLRKFAITPLRRAICRDVLDALPHMDAGVAGGMQPCVGRGLRHPPQALHRASAWSNAATLA